MLVIKNITIKNFMSIGNVTQVVDLNRPYLTLVLGNNVDLGGDGSRNGTGKTTLINALSFALYGNALTNIRKNNLINKTNGKGMLVTVDFSYNGDEFRIERGRGPNIFRLIKNGIDMNGEEDHAQGEMKETQVEVDNIIGISHSMFKHIVALNTYTEPFLSMRANDQRELIEELLGITELSRKADLLKEQIKNTKDLIKEEEFNLSAKEQANKRILENIKSIERRSSIWDKTHQENLEELADALDALSHVDIEEELQLHGELELYNTSKKKADEAADWISRIEKDTKKQETLITKLENEITLLKEHKCHSCGQDIHDTKQEEILQSKQDLLKDAQMQVISNTSQMQLHYDTIEEVGELGDKPKPFYSKLAEAYEHQNSVKYLQEQIESKYAEQNPYQDQITEMRESALEEINYDNMNSMIAFKEHQEFLLKMLTNKDSFIRKKIIDQNLGYLNTRLEYYLDKLGLPHMVVFQSDLSVEITELGRELDFDNLSRGERNRLILGLSWAFRDIFESMYTSINVLFVDELMDSGMDTNGAESALSALKKMTREQNRSIFLVSHKEELMGRVSNILHVLKENGFTTFEQED